MKRILLVLGISLVALLAFTGAASAQGSEEPPEPYTGTALCLPDAYLNEPENCLALGPSQTLTEMAKKGMSYPPKPVPMMKPPSDLTVSPVTVAKINIPGNEPAMIYGSAADAAAGTNPVRSIQPGQGLRYVSYIAVQEIDGKKIVQLKTGEWMRASPAGYSNFQGLLFSKTPTTEVGWVIDHIKARSAPSWNAPEVGEIIYRETAVQIFDIVEAEGSEWFMIGPDQWVPWLKARRVRVDTTPPPGVTGDRWISVNLYDQTLAVYDNRQLVFATLIASGVEPLYTRPGLFKVFEKKPLETMNGAFENDKSDFYYLEDVPWTMYFDEARALHGAYWRSWFGHAGTHGCVNLSIGDSNWLFNWAKEGDWVYVWDPSGQTPTDPSLYGAGGA